MTSTKAAGAAASPGHDAHSTDQLSGPISLDANATSPNDQETQADRPLTPAPCDAVLNIPKPSKLKAALDLAAQGYRVFPLQVNSKNPLNIPWTLCATTDTTIITDWWIDSVTGFERDNNVGVLANGYITLDVDVKNGKRGMETMFELGLEFGETRTIRTPSRGYHIVYQGIETDVGAAHLVGPQDGIDVKSFNGYTVGPGSTIDGVEYVVEWDIPVAPFPAHLIPLLKPPRKRVEAASVDFEPDTPEIVERATHWLRQDAPIAVQGAGGDEQTYRVACRLRDLGVSEETAAELMIEAWNDNCEPPWPIDELRGKVENAYSYAKGIAGAKSPAAQFGRATITPPVYQDDAFPVESTLASQIGHNGGPPLMEALPLSEDTMALRVAERYCNRLRFCHDRNAWFEWTGLHWKQDDTGLAFDLVRTLVRELATEKKDSDRKAAGKTNTARAVEYAAQRDRAFAMTTETWDRDPWLLGTPGGTVDLRTGKMQPAKPLDGITKLVSATPAERADCPLWLRFLDQATGGDTATIRFLQQWAGYCLTGDTREQQLVFIHGEGGNGKGLLITILKAALGAYAKTADMVTFTASKNDRHPTELADLCGARLVTSSETEKGRHWAEARLKLLTGGDDIKAHFMRQDGFEYRPTFKLMFIGNKKPRLTSVDDAMRRRFNIVEFKHKPAIVDKDLEQKLRTEMPGILRWMIEGCVDWQHNGLLQPESVTAATKDYFASQDVFRQWIDEECECGNSEFKGTRDQLFRSFTLFCQNAGEEPISRTDFVDNLKGNGYHPKKGTKGCRPYIGIRLRRIAEVDVL